MSTSTAGDTSAGHGSSPVLDPTSDIDDAAADAVHDSFVDLFGGDPLDTAGLDDPTQWGSPAHRADPVDSLDALDVPTVDRGWYDDDSSEAMRAQLFLDNIADDAPDPTVGA